MTSNEGFKSVAGGWQCLMCGMVVDDPYKPRHEHGDHDMQVAALAIHLGVDPKSIEETRHSSDTFECEHEPGEYRVLTESERERAANEALESHIDDCIFGNLRGEYGKKGGMMANMLNTLERYFDRASWKRDALISDGYGHTLSGHDGQEHEVKIGDTWYFIYRVN